MSTLVSFLRYLSDEKERARQIKLNKDAANWKTNYSNAATPEEKRLRLSQMSNVVPDVQTMRGLQDFVKQGDNFQRTNDFRNSVQGMPATTGGVDSVRRKFPLLAEATQIDRLLPEDQIKGMDKGYATYLRANGLQPSPETYKAFQQQVTAQESAGATNVNNYLDVGTKSMTELGKKMSSQLVDERKDVVGAVNALESLKEARKLLNDGIITGTGAQFLTNMGSFLNERLGINYAEDPIANTQAFFATMGTQVGQIIKQFGSGTGLSDADREYAQKIVGGEITLTKPAIERLFRINEKAHRNVIKMYNKKAEQAMKRPGSDQLPYDLRIDYQFDETQAQQPTRSTSLSPMQGAKQAPDGNWYIEKDGQFYRVEK